MLVILIGVIGGTLSHGLLGLFLGPVVLSVFYELLRAWAWPAAASTGSEHELAAGFDGQVQRSVQ